MPRVKRGRTSGIVGGAMLFSVMAGVASAAVAGGGPAPVPARPNSFSFPPWGEFGCIDDSECQNTSSCIPQPGGSFPGTCYVPKNRFLSLEDNAANVGMLTARRVSVMSQGVPVVLGWMGEPAVAGALGDVLVSKLTTDGQPLFRDWSLDAAPVHLTGCAIYPQRSYVIESTLDGLSFSEVLALPTVTQWADATGAVAGGVVSPPQGVANLVDASRMVKGFQDINSEPYIWLDVHPPAGNNLVVNMIDAVMALHAKLGQQFVQQSGAFESPCDCPEVGLPACPP